MYGTPPRFSGTNSISILDDPYNDDHQIHETFADHSVRAGKADQIIKNYGNKLKRKVVLFNDGDEIWKEN